MPFLAPIGAAIGSALAGVFSFLTGGSLLAKIVIVGLSIAARYAVQALLGKDEPDKPQPQASQLETRYGEDLARTVILGTVGTAGHHVYRNAYGPGNTIIQDVYVLSHFRVAGLPRIQVDGVWRTLGGSLDSARGYRVQDVDGQIWVKLYTGTMAQTADAELISRSNPSGRWTSAHRGAGVAYAIVTSVLDKEHLRSPWQGMFEVQGAPLYDWRKDTTAGGSGAHRWSNQATWEYSENPVLQMYALERGIFNGTEMMVGKGVDASDLPLAEWTVAANICDEEISFVARYRASCIVSSGVGVTHDANLQPLLEACAGSWVELVGQEYPLVGANQASVATITDDDIVTGERRRVSMKRPRSELVNTVAGSYISPDTFYQSAPLATRIDSDALAADRERLAVSIPYRAVTVATVGDRLADIAIRASRYQASAEICVRPKYLGLKPGQWVTWQSDRHGWTKKFQVLTKQLGAFGTSSVRNVYLALQEVSDGIFDPTAYTTLPPDATGQGAPDFQSELANFTVSPYTVVSEDLKQFPAIRAQWDWPADPTVIGIDIEYRPQFQSAATIAHPTVADDVTVAILINGVISSKVYEVRYRLATSPYRATPWSDWTEVVTPSTPATDILVSLREVQNDVRNVLQRVSSQYQALIRPELDRLALAAAEGLGAAHQEVAAVAKYGDALAASFLLLDAAVNDSETGLAALATAVLGVETSVNDLAAGGRIAFRAQVPPPDGVYAQIEVMARASDGDAFLESGMVIQVLSNGSGGFKSQILLLADRLAVTNGSTDSFPFVFEAGVLKLNSMWAKTITSPLLVSPDGKKRIDMANGILDFQF